MNRCLTHPCSALCGYFSEFMADEMSEEEWGRIHEYTSCSHYKRGETLFHQGDTPKALYYVGSGRVKLYKSSQRGKKCILYITGAKNFIGYRSLLSEELYAATAVALEDTEICALPRHVFFELFEKHSLFMWKIARTACHRMKAMEGKIMDFAYGSVLERLAGNLLMLEASYGVQHEGRRMIDIVLSREDLASIVGAATETVIRMLSEFRLEGVVSFKGKKICIEKPKKLILWAGDDSENIV